MEHCADCGEVSAEREHKQCTDSAEALSTDEGIRNTRRNIMPGTNMGAATRLEWTE
jgi:hypothetical protein